MVIVTPNERKEFFRANYGAHLPGYTGHCPTLKFRVGKRFGANTQEIMKELLEKKILKTGPYQPSTESNYSDEMLNIKNSNDGIRRDWKNDTNLYKTPPYILGYTGYIPGFNNKYGLPFMRAVEEGGKEWREAQNKLRMKRDVIRAQMERTNPRNLLSRAKTDNVNVEIDHGFERERTYFDHQVSPERPPIVGYTGHIPGARSELALSKRYAQAARKGLELLQKGRERRLDKIKEANAVERVLNNTYLDETGHSRA